MRRQVVQRTVGCDVDETWRVRPAAIEKSHLYLIVGRATRTSWVRRFPVTAPPRSHCRCYHEYQPTEWKTRHLWSLVGPSISILNASYKHGEHHMLPRKLVGLLGCIRHILEHRKFISTLSEQNPRLASSSLSTQL